MAAEFVLLRRPRAPLAVAAGPVAGWHGRKPACGATKPNVRLCSPTCNGPIRWAAMAKRTPARPIWTPGPEGAPFDTAMSKHARLLPLPSLPHVGPVCPP